MLFDGVMPMQSIKEVLNLYSFVSSFELLLDVLCAYTMRPLLLQFSFGLVSSLPILSTFSTNHTVFTNNSYQRQRLSSLKISSLMLGAAVAFPTSVTYDEVIAANERFDEENNPYVYSFSLLSVITSQNLLFLRLEENFIQVSISQIG